MESKRESDRKRIRDKERGYERERGLEGWICRLKDKIEAGRQ